MTAAATTGANPLAMRLSAEEEPRAIEALTRRLTRKPYRVRASAAVVIATNAVFAARDNCFYALAALLECDRLSFDQARAWAVEFGLFPGRKAS